MATRARFSSGCWAVSDTPDVWTWVRSCHDRGSRAPTRSRISVAHIRRAARIFATSSNRSLWKLKKNEKRGRKRSGSTPRAVSSSTYARPSAIVNASSWAAVAPASRMWYPLIDTGCQSGISSVQNAIRSPISRIAGRSGTTHSFWAMNSLRMSAWSVPRSSCARHARALRRHHEHRQRDRGGPGDRHRRRHRAEVDPVEEARHVVGRGHRDALRRRPRPPTAGGPGRSPSASACRRPSRAPSAPPPAGGGSGRSCPPGAPKPGEHAHRPATRPVHLRVDAPRVGVLARRRDVAVPGGGP